MRFQSPYVSLSFASYSYDFHVIFQRNVCKSDIYIFFDSINIEEIERNLFRMVERIWEFEKD